jgi:hypothetical protein
MYVAAPIGREGSPAADVSAVALWGTGGLHELATLAAEVFACAMAPKFLRRLCATHDMFARARRSNQ